MRLAHSSHGAGSAPTAMAIDAGHFRERGIAASMLEVARTSDALALVLSGEAELGIVSGAPILTAAYAGGDPLIVMSIESENIFGIVGSKQTRTPEDLRGGVVGVSGPGDTDNIVMRRALRDWGLQPDVDVELRAFPDRGSLWAAIGQDEIQAMGSTAPQPILARAQGFPVLRDFTETPMPYQLGAIVTTRRFADDHGDLLTDYLAAQLQGVQDFADDFDRATPYLKARTKLEDLDVLRMTHEVFSTALGRHVPSLAALEAIALDLSLATGEPIPIDLRPLVDGTYAPA